MFSHRERAKLTYSIHVYVTSSEVHSNQRLAMHQQWHSYDEAAQPILGFACSAAVRDFVKVPYV